MSIRSSEPNPDPSGGHSTKAMLYFEALSKQFASKAYYYTATPQKATAVNLSITGNFTGAKHLNLLVVRNTRMELFIVTPEGLKSLKEISINGRVAVAIFFKMPNEEKDLLFILTAKYHVAILECNDEGEILTRSYGNVQDKIGRASETGIIAVIDPACSMVGLRLYDGLFKVIPLEKDIAELKAFNIRFEEQQVVDICFLQDAEVEKPTIAFIYQDNKGRHIKTCGIDLTDKEFHEGPWSHDNVESEATVLIPLPPPYGGVVVIGQESITYHRGDTPLAVAPPVLKQSTINCFGRVDKDGSRFLLGDLTGRLYMMLLELAQSASGKAMVKNIKVELLGEIAIPESLTYLDNGVIFVGSRMGDSQLIRLNVERDDTGSFVTVLDSFTNLGPIVDMIVVDLERQGQGQLITCSGLDKEGSLRIIRNGIGIQEHASIDLPGIKGLWPLKFATKEEFHNILVISFVGQTRFLMLSGEEVEETEIAGTDPCEQAFYAGNFGVDIVLVTGAAARIISGDKQGMLSEWKPADGRTIGVVATNAAGGQLLVASGKEVYCLSVDGTEIKEVAHCTMENEVACMDISPIGSDNQSEVAAIGFWTEISVKLIHLPSMKVMFTEPLGGEIIPRSIMMVRFDEILYLLVALGDGTLFYYQMDSKTGALGERKIVTLGTQPTTLRMFNSSNGHNVFACSDRPSVIYSSNQKLVFSNVNLKMVSQMTSLNSLGYPDSLALVDEHSLIIGTVDEIQMLHIRTVPLGETPRRLAHQESTQTFGVLTSRTETLDKSGKSKATRVSASCMAASSSQSSALLMPASAAGSSSSGTEGEENEVHNFLLLDQNTFEVLHCHEFGPNEEVLSIVSCKLGDDPVPYFVVGTAVVIKEEAESKLGRLSVFQYADGKLHTITEKEIKGAPLSLVEFNGRILAAVNSSIRLHEWTPEKELRLECSDFNFVIALYLKVKGDFVLAGDLMRSISLLAYKHVESSFEEIARDYDPKWMTAVEIVDDDNFLGAENAFNLFACQKLSDAIDASSRDRLSETGKFHVGEMINVFRQGSLVMHHAGDSGAPVHNSVLFGTVQGAVGVVMKIPENYFKFLQDLEARLARTIKPVGKISHAMWRSYQDDHGATPNFGFIDGDLVESFLDLNRHMMSEVIDGLQMPDASGTKNREATVDDIIKITEELSRTH